MTECDVCSSTNIVYIDQAEIGMNHAIRLWPYVWFCRDCRASVGCHPGTDRPLGYMANAYVRSLRAELHEIIDPLWHSNLATRTEVYIWIAKELGISTSLCHIAQLSISQLKQAIEFCGKYATLNCKRIKKAQFNDKQRNQRHKAAANKRRFRPY